MPNALQTWLDGPTGKKWDMPTCFNDHVRAGFALPTLDILTSGCASQIMFLKSHGTLFGAYTGCGSPAIEHDLVEAIMVAVNSVNECPYCDGLHGELARMAGTEGAVDLRSGKTSAVDEKCAAAVTYAVIFGKEDGVGDKEEEALVKLSASEGGPRAASIKALCGFLMWGR